MIPVGVHVSHTGGFGLYGMGTQFSFSSQVSQAEHGSQVWVTRLHFSHGPQSEMQTPPTWHSSHGSHLLLQKPQWLLSSCETQALLQSI
jgi:hypothetical protein